MYKKLPFLLNLKVHYNIYKSSLLGPMLTQLNSVPKSTRNFSITVSRPLSLRQGSNITSPVHFSIIILFWSVCVCVCMYVCMCTYIWFIPPPQFLYLQQMSPINLVAKRPEHEALSSYTCTACCLNIEAILFAPYQPPFRCCDRDRHSLPTLSHHRQRESNSNFRVAPT